MNTLYKYAESLIKEINKIFDFSEYEYTHYLQVADELFSKGDKKESVKKELLYAICKAYLEKN